MIDLKQFAALQKASKNSFAEQKKIIKKVTSGQTVLCPICKQPLKLKTPEHYAISGICCDKGCTDIQLDFV